jgi:hypothetical protein
MLGIPFAAILFYVFVYLPLAAVLAPVSIVPDSPVEIGVMFLGTNVFVMMIGRSVLRDREARAAREAELVGRTDGAPGSPPKDFPPPGTPATRSRKPRTPPSATVVFRRKRASFRGR